MKSLFLCFVMLLAQSCWYEVPGSNNYPIFVNDKGKVVDVYLDREVKHTMLYKAREFQICYNQFVERKSNQKLKSKSKSKVGSLHIDWMIDANGAASDTRILYNSIQDEKLAKCCERVILESRFPPPGKSRYAHHKLRFSLEKQTADAESILQKLNQK